MHSNVRHTGIYVSDIGKMKSFYAECFGLAEKSHGNEGGNYLETLLGVNNIAIENYKLCDKNGFIIELIKTEDDYERHVFPKVCHIGCLHVAFTVSNIDKVCHFIQENGGEMISKPIFSPDGKVKVCFCRDPEGNYLELVEEQ